MQAQFGTDVGTDQLWCRAASHFASMQQENVDRGMDASEGYHRWANRVPYWLQLFCDCHRERCRCDGRAWILEPGIWLR